MTAWPEVAERAMRLFSEGFRDRDEREGLVLLAPARWENARYDEIKQELTRVICDGDGRELTLLLSYTEETKNAITLLEQYAPGQGARVLGILRLRHGRVVVEPIALHDAPHITNLTLDEPKLSSPARKFGKPQVSNNSDDDGVLTPLGLLLGAMQSELETFAEGGLTVIYQTDHLQELTARAGAVGLESCTAVTTRLLDTVNRLRREPGHSPISAATELLHAYYVLQQAVTMETLLQATQPLGAPSS
jgi:hypothetical protein